jgi:glycosyltransferase involved in cell wall biosynthesis
MSPEAFRPRVLLIAEAANPEWSSVPLVGWSHARALAEVAGVHLVTQLRNREAILRAGLVETRDFTSIDSESVARPLHWIAQGLRGGSGLGWTTVSALSSLSYYRFEDLVWRRFRERLRNGEFDLVHRLTPLSPVTPSLLAGRCRRIGIPFVLGPLNGGLPWPAGFDRVRRQEHEWLSYLRSAYRLLPMNRSTLTDAAAVIAGSRSAWEQVINSCRSRCVYIPENAIDPARFPPPQLRRPSSGLKTVFLGRLVPYKGPDILLESAIPLIRARRLHLTFIGDGPMRPALEEVVRSEGLQEGVSFSGWIEQREVHRHLGEADVLGFPSIREFGGAVALEGMASGAVPIVVDYGGPGELVTEATGYRIGMGPRHQIMERLRATLHAIASDPAQLGPRREAGYRRVLTSFTWSAKARQVLEIYRWILGKRPDRPDFGMPFPDSRSAG